MAREPMALIVFVEGDEFGRSRRVPVSEVRLEPIQGAHAFSDGLVLFRGNKCRCRVANQGGQALSGALRAPRHLVPGGSVGPE